VAWDNGVNIATGLPGSTVWGLFRGLPKEFFSCWRHLDQLWYPPNLFNGYWEFFSFMNMARMWSWSFTSI